MAKLHVNYLKDFMKKDEKSQKSASFSQKSPIFPILIPAKICKWESNFFITNKTANK